MSSFTGKKLPQHMNYDKYEWRIQRKKERGPASDDHLAFGNILGSLDTRAVDADQGFFRTFSL